MQLTISFLTSAINHTFLQDREGDLPWVQGRGGVPPGRHLGGGLHPEARWDPGHRHLCKLFLVVQQPGHFTEKRNNGIIAMGRVRFGPQLYKKLSSTQQPASATNAFYCQTLAKVLNQLLTRNFIHFIRHIFAPPGSWVRWFLRDKIWVKLPFYRQIKSLQQWKDFQ